MPQLSLYLDHTTMALMQQSAQRQHRSMSAYVADLIREKLSDKWPDGYFDLYGSLSDESLQRPDQLDFLLDAKRSLL